MKTEEEIKKKISSLEEAIQISHLIVFTAQRDILKWVLEEGEPRV